MGPNNEQQIFELDADIASCLYEFVPVPPVFQ